jgi:hypothetical protein
MSNNRLWKRQLQDKINEHNRQHGVQRQLALPVATIRFAG